MMKYEWRKEEKSLYSVKQMPILVEITKQNLFR